MNRKITAAAVVLVILLLLFCACGKKEEPDTTAPVISGAKDITVNIGGKVSYREGVTATDDRDGEVAIEIDSHMVNLNAKGDYPVTYSAVDAAGNKAEKTIMVTVVSGGNNPSSSSVSEDELNALCDSILKKITNSSMSQKEVAKAIHTYLYNNIKYVHSTLGEDDWMYRAYMGITEKKGDCFSYHSAAKALLTRAGIKNLDIQRYNGNTKHYWNLVFLEGGWYHFDCCWAPNGYKEPHNGFMMTESEVREYTKTVYANIPSRPNYLAYDYANCPVYIEGTPKSAYSQYKTLISKGILPAE